MSDKDMTIRAIAPWFGAKRTLAPIIVEELGPHQMYVEPFCGGMSVLMAKPVSGSETANDLYDDLTNLAMVVASVRWGDLYDRLARTLCCEGLFADCKGRFLAEQCYPPSSARAVLNEHVQRAYDYFVISWMGRNGVSGTERVDYQMAKRWSPGGGSGGLRFVSAVGSVPAWHERLRAVTILRMDAFELLGKLADNEKTVIYADPPYLRGPGSSRTSPARYRHEFRDGSIFGPSDHQRLATELGRFKKARVVVSYYDEPELADLYPGWTKRPLAAQKSLALANRQGSKASVAPEVLLINGDSYGA